MTGKKLPVTSMPIVSFGSVLGSLANPTTVSVNATSPSKLWLRSRTST
jgi:hypothetical protein